MNWDYFLIGIGIFLGCGCVVGIGWSIRCTYLYEEAEDNARDWLERNGYDTREVEIFLSCNDDWDFQDFKDSEGLKKAYARWMRGRLPPIKKHPTPATRAAPIIMPPMIIR
jgi:hypothetical protein